MLLVLLATGHQLQPVYDSMMHAQALGELTLAHLCSSTDLQVGC